MSAKTSSTPPRRLPLVSSELQLSGRHPRQFERLAKSCAAGDTAHNALLYGAAAMSARGLSQCLPPGSRKPYSQALELVHGWCAGRVAYKELRDARAQLFRDAPDTELAVQRSMAVALRSQGDPSETILDPHADQVVQRYLGLCIHHAIGAVLLVIDAAKNAPLVLEVPGEVAGAVSYKQVALGAARNQDLRNAAVAQAKWEHRRVQASGGHNEAALSVQLFHEYLGVHWKNHVDAQRLYLEEFVCWAFPQ